MEADKRPPDIGTALGVPVFDEIPEGWIDIGDIASSPSGYRWINNGKSIFSKDYQHGLLRITNTHHFPNGGEIFNRTRGPVQLELKFK